MAETKDKFVTAESAKALHEYNKNTYLPLVGGTVTGELVFEDFAVFGNNNRGIVGVDNAGNQYHQFQPVNDKGNCTIGFGMYENKVGSTDIFGNMIHLTSQNDSALYVKDGGLTIETTTGLNLNNDIHFNTNNACRIYAIGTDGQEYNVFHGKNAENNTVIGYDNYVKANGMTNIYGGKAVNIISAGGAVAINGREYGYNKLLWSGVRYMGKVNNAVQAITLNDKISAQPNGVVFMWSWYDTDKGDAKDYNWHYHFVPKRHLVHHAGEGVNFQLALSGHGTVSGKYLYIRDTEIIGSEANNKSGTGASGIKYNNSKFVLRGVIGV